MGKIEYFSYVWKCVLGGEIVYAVCLGGAFVLDRTQRGTEMHHTMFETMPGFVWLDAPSVMLGAMYILAFSIIFGIYMVWMHNSSISG